MTKRNYRNPDVPYPVPKPIMEKMTINKAIQILETENKNPWNWDNSPLRHAVKLGIEALRREQILRREVPYDRDGLLPGETEE